MKRTKLYIILFLLVSNYYTNGQVVDYDKIIIPGGNVNLEMREKLVRIAWLNHPGNNTLYHEKRIAEFEHKRSKWSFLENFQAVGNLNEFILEGTEEDLNRFFPKYNLSARVSLGMFITIPYENKVNKEKIVVAENNIKQQKLALRAEVLKRYEAYLKNKELVRIQTEMTEDAYSAFSLVEQKFTDGEITYTDYNIALERYNNQLMKKVNLESDLNIAQIELEELLGVPLEEVN